MTSIEQPGNLTGIRDDQLVQLTSYGSRPSIEVAPITSQQAREAAMSNRKSIIIVASSFTIIFTCCGLNFAFGVFQELYDAMSQQPGTPFTGATPALIDLIGTISISLMTIGAPFSVAWAKHFSPRWVSFIGGFIFALSLILASFGTKLWHFELTQGLLLGLGTSMPYMVAVTIAPGWFTTHRGLAMGIILAGTGVGGLVWAPVIKAMIDNLGFRNALRVSGVISFVLTSLSSAAMAWDPQTLARISVENASRAGRLRGVLQVPLIDWRVAKSRKFAAQGLGAIFQAAAYYTPVFFFASYAGTLGYSATAGANFIALSNACNAIGKVVIGYFADRLGRLNTLFLTTFVSAAVTVGFWVPSTVYGSTDDSRGLFVSFAVFYGLFASAYVSLFPASLIEIFGMQNFASVNGVLYMVRGMATLVGTPVAGALIRSSTGSAALLPHAYINMAVLVSVLLFAASIAVFWIRLEAMVGPSGKMSLKWRM
ncbi:MFS monocarboxylate transporter [Annulohypoxylon bovei var. microspora]|nr:MFS monocarboxylate transporter [Annulohypoxylon bovei var. microspora]